MPDDLDHRPRRKGKARATACAVTLAVAAVPVAYAAPAQAITYYGCTVEALKPTVEPTLNPAGRKVIKYRWTSNCVYDDYSLDFRVRLMEEDNGYIGDAGWQDDQVAVRYFYGLPTPKGTMQTWYWSYPLMDTDNYNIEEVYSAVSFRVCNISAPTVCTGWSKEDKSDVLNVHYS